MGLVSMFVAAPPETMVAMVLLQKVALLVNEVLIKTMIGMGTWSVVVVVVVLIGMLMAEMILGR